MASRNKKIINIPILNDFVYTLLYEAPYEAKRGLAGRYLKAAMNGRSAKAFSVNSTREEKEYILSHFGVEFYYVVNPKTMKLPILKEILKKYQNDKRVSAMKDIAQEGIFVTSDEQFTHLLKLMGKSIHHPAFFLNLEINRQGYHIQKWSKKTNDPTDLKDRETCARDIIVAQFMLNTLLEISAVPGKQSLTEKEMKVLIYFYVYKHLFIPDEDITDFFAGRMSKTEYRKALHGLLKMQYIQRSALVRNEYSITSIGIKQASAFRDSVLKSQNF